MADQKVEKTPTRNIDNLIVRISADSLSLDQGKHIHMQGWNHSLRYPGGSKKYRRCSRLDNTTNHYEVIKTKVENISECLRETVQLSKNFTRQFSKKWIYIRWNIGRSHLRSHLSKPTATTPRTGVRIHRKPLHETASSIIPAMKLLSVSSGSLS